MLPVKHLNRSLLGSVDLAPSDSVPVTKRVPVGPEIHASRSSCLHCQAASGLTKQLGTLWGLIMSVEFGTL